MRLQIASLISAAGIAAIAANAFAQDATPPAPPPPPMAPAGPPAPPPAAAPAPTAAPPAAPAAPAQPGAPAPATPGDASQPPAAPAEAPATPPPPPTLPTSGDGYEIIQVLNNVCEPGVKAGDLDARAKANGFKKTRDFWVKPLGAKPYVIKLEFFSVANPNVCIMHVEFAAGAAQPIVDGLTTWAYLHEPYMQNYRNDEYKQDILRRTISWEHVGENGASTGLVFSIEKNPDGSSMSKVGDAARISFQIRNGG